MTALTGSSVELPSSSTHGTDPALAEGLTLEGCCSAARRPRRRAPTDREPRWDLQLTNLRSYTALGGQGWPAPYVALHNLA